MSNGKGKEIATKPDWKQQLAILDQELGWDDDICSDWAESGDLEKHQKNNTPKPPPSDYNNNGLHDQPKAPQNDQMVYHNTEHDDAAGAIMKDYDYAASCDAAQCIDSDINGTYRNTSDYLLEEDDITSLEMQKSIWEAAVMEAKGADKNQPQHDASEPCEDTITSGTDDEQGHMEYYPEEHTSQCAETNSQWKIYYSLCHGEDYRYEHNCWCAAWLHDATEERNKYMRAYYQYRGEGLMKDRCVLLPHPQEELPGTEEVDKPMLMVTTPEGETLWPHDLEEYPEPKASKGWPAAKGNYVVPYEDEDGADI
ncbi:hypothetical protein diail_7917 [Diaporthe ilicicola]|nr:hypothetical protein diail_7917 [Diaporthe ilicicola]